jgi:hypothetical protein
MIDTLKHVNGGVGVDRRGEGRDLVVKGADEVEEFV